MSFQAKTDYIGLESDNLKLKANGENASNSVLEIVGSDGSILNDVISGHIKAPSCEYAIAGTVNLSNIKLGECINAPYAIQSIRVSTSAGGEPSFSVSAVQIESGANRTICVYPVDSITLTPAHHSLTFGAFTYTESESLVLNSCEFEASASVTPATINNEPVASDSTQGKEIVTATFWSDTDENHPTISTSADWHITSDWSCTGSDGALFVWTVTLTKYLEASQS